MHLTRTALIGVILLAIGSVHSLAADKNAAPKKQPKFAAADVTFFKTKVQPLLAARCFKCHSTKTKEPKGGLRLDSRAALLKGGETGPAAVAGKPKKSLLIEAILYESLEMPPRSKLPKGEIAILTKWVKLGLPWSKEAPGQVVVDTVFPLQERKRSHWAWQPIGRPKIPNVKNQQWARTEIDRFILAKLEEKQISPSPQAARRVLIRRATFDLIGLPPSPNETTEFVNDPAATPTAFAKVVDRLLKSPQFGERWARHWLDLVRYAETLGHEFDYPLHHAHEYRDYVIRALNADVPYNQFVTEHIAGDLLKNPRRHPQLGYNESVIGTGFWFLGEDKHAPVDVKGEEAGRIDNRLDVFGKTFLGLALGCARCHDHKFDAISAKDYYALAGFLQSSHQRTALLDPRGTIGKKTAELAALKQQGDKLLRESFAKVPSGFEQVIANYLLASRGVMLDPRKNRSAALKRAAEQFRVDETRLRNLVAAMQSKDVDRISHPMCAWKQLALKAGKDFPNRAVAVGKQIAAGETLRKRALEKSPLITDFNEKDFGKWLPTGFAFGDAPTQPGEWNSLDSRSSRSVPGIAHSGRFSKKLGGVLRSPTFTLTHDQILYRVKGENAQIRLVIDGYVMNEFSGLLFSGTKFKINTKGKWIWHRQAGDVHRYKGHRAHIEIIDDGNGWIAVDEIRFVNRRDPTPPDEPFALVDASRSKTASELAARYASKITSALGNWGAVDADAASLVRFGESSGLLTSENTRRRLASIQSQMRKLESTIPQPMRVLAITDGSSEDEHLFIRGSHKNLGPIVPRRMLEAISGAKQPQIASGSGRLELANRVLDLANPFPARVIVNRLWHHLFGKGIVGSVDNFGVLGQRPTHPELLDHLASNLRRDGWSIKRLIRRIMLSNTYLQSSNPNQKSVETDPRNLLRHHMPVRRLESEAIRDAMLAVSGRLDKKMFGPSVPVFLTRFMQGRGRPRRSGPLDGNGRRSLYISVNRNFLPPMMLAFDTPIPFNTIGRRNVSNVPAQALILMNDPFVTQQAGLWAKRVLAEKELAPEGRIRQMYETAFARPPKPTEITQGIAFLKLQSKSLGANADAWKTDVRVWTDFCHVMFNVKEFVFLR